MLHLHYLGHASWQISDGSTTILCDPWFNPEGAFFSSWFPFPANDFLRPEDYASPSAVYLSHTHEDHFDPWFLNQLNRTIPVICPKFASKRMVRRLKSMGFQQVQELAHGQEWAVSSFNLRMFIDEDYGMYQDSTLLLEHSEGKILNMNDCRLDKNTARALGEQGIDVVLKYFSGASPYPLAYDSYDEASMHEVCAKKRKQHLESLLTYSRLVKARVTVPCSGPAAFLDPDLFGYNDFGDQDTNPFPNMPVAVAYLRDHEITAELMVAGDCWRLGEHNLTLASRLQSPDSIYARKREYLQAYADRKAPIIQAALLRLEAHPDPLPMLQKLIAELKASKWLVPRISMTVRIELTGKWPACLILIFDPSHEPKLLADDDRACQYRYTFDTALLADLLMRPTVDFEDLFLSLRFRAWRDPDLFNYYFYVLLKNMDAESLVEVESLYMRGQNRSIVFTLQHADLAYEVQKFCPHLGEDLSKTGILKDGTLTCPRHGWRFRLADGVCTNIEGERLSVRQLPWEPPFVLKSPLDQ